MIAGDDSTRRSADPGDFTTGSPRGQVDEADLGRPRPRAVHRPRRACADPGARLHDGHDHSQPPGRQRSSERDEDGFASTSQVPGQWGSERFPGRFGSCRGRSAVAGYTRGTQEAALAVTGRRLVLLAVLAAVPVACLSTVAGCQSGGTCGWIPMQGTSWWPAVYVPPLLVIFASALAWTLKFGLVASRAARELARLPRIPIPTKLIRTASAVGLERIECVRGEF